MRKKNIIPCPICGVNTIDQARNKRKKCKKCADKERSKKKQKQVSLLTYEGGCKRALHNNSNASIIVASLLECYPVTLKISSYNKSRKNIVVPALLHTQEVDQLSNELNINFGDISKTFEAELQLSEQIVNNHSCKKCDNQVDSINFADISKIVSSSSLPNLLEFLGPYEEVDAETIRLLITDFRLNHNKMNLIPKLFTGALIHGKLTLMTITSEVYSRYHLGTKLA